jgi:hypothetical protein
MRSATQIEAAFTDPLTLVVDLDRDLSSKGQISQASLHAESSFIDRHEEAGAKNAMNLDRGSQQL